MVNVGKDTVRPMDPMGIQGIIMVPMTVGVKFKPLPRISVSFATWLPEIGLLGAWKKIAFPHMVGEEW